MNHNIKSIHTLTGKVFALFVLALSFSNLVMAQKVIRLYPGKAPGSEKWNWQEGETPETHVAYNVVDPTLTVFLPDAKIANGTAMLICPGGGFHTLSMQGEGTDLAKWCTDRGITAFILKYRLERTYTAEPWKEATSKMMKSMKNFSVEIDSVVTMAIADGKEAMKYIKQHTGDYHIAPNRIGMMGFSAGGTVTAAVGLNYSDENRPDFLVPVYPYIDAIKVQNARTGMPPMFICAATNDSLGIAAQSANLYTKWINAGNSAELHLYAKGGHGFGLGKKGTATVTWTDRLKEWMDAQGYLTAAK